MLSDQNRNSEFKEQIRSILSRDIQQYLSRHEYKFLKNLVSELNRESYRIMAVRRRIYESLRSYIENHNFNDVRAINNRLRDLEKLAAKIAGSNINLNQKTGLLVLSGRYSVSSPHFELFSASGRINLGDIIENENGHELSQDMIDQMRTVDVRKVAHRIRDIVSARGPMTILQITALQPITEAAALQRLRNPNIGGLSISDADVRKFNSAIKLRNELTHFEFSYSRQYAEARFADIFSFMVFFYRKYLLANTDDFIDHEQHTKIINIVKAKADMLRRADEYIQEGDFSDVWECPSCKELTFIPFEEQCCFCQHKEDLIRCPNCRVVTLEGELIELSDLFDYYEDEGRYMLVSNFTYSCDFGCPECIDKIKSDIQDRRMKQHYQEMEMEYYYRTQTQHD